MKFCRLILASLMLVFYNGVVTHGIQTHHLAEKYMTGYNWLSASFREGRLYVAAFDKSQLPGDLLDVKKNSHWIGSHHFEDLSIYNGKLYAYFGIAPVLTLYLPYQVATRGGMMSDEMAALIFGYGGFLWSFALLASLRRRYYPDSTGWTELAAAAVLGACNLMPYMLACTKIYEVAVASGFFFTSAALYFLFGGELGRLSGKRAAAAGLMLGLAVGSRPHLLIPALFLAALAFRQAPRRSFTMLAAPLAFCAAGLALYNYARFENPFEFGVKYQLNFNNQNMGAKYWGLSNWVTSLWSFLFHPPHIDMRTYPYLKLNSDLPSFVYRPPGSLFGYEPFPGFLTSTPFILVGALLSFPAAARSLLARATGRMSDAPKRLPREFWGILQTGGVTVALLCLFHFVAPRYAGDFTVYFLLAGGLLWLHADGPGRASVRWLGASFAVLSILIHAAYVVGVKC
ncbi:MAG TPA: glycosyltransferase family 87 protein [Candidatus Eisenbacteria bacterium]|nr:glycosyltransferase family 87 protein [Candidatus Eisenbacteria bacterium]